MSANFEVRPFLELLAFNAQNYKVTWPWPHPLFESFAPVCWHSGVVGRQ